MSIGSCTDTDESGTRCLCLYWNEFDVYCRHCLQESLELFAVEPLPFCPHLTMVEPLPVSGHLSSHAPCEQCGAVGENWVCLTCYQVLPLISAVCKAA